jgi:hypothetical protein
VTDPRKQDLSEMEPGEEREFGRQTVRRMRGDEYAIKTPGESGYQPAIGVDEALEYLTDD